MKKTRSVIFSKHAERQLDVLHDRIEQVSGTERANAFIGAIVSHCGSLALFPERGTLRGDLGPGIRILGFRRRVAIAVAVEPELVVILGIYYGGRDYQAALGDLLGSSR